MADLTLEPLSSNMGKTKSDIRVISADIKWLTLIGMGFGLGLMSVIVWLLTEVMGIRVEMAEMAGILEQLLTHVREHTG